MDKMTGVFTPTGEQDRIVNHNGNVIVIANPGTGKTTTLALKVMQLLEQGVSPEDILCITFTKKARREMHKRINELAKDRFSEQIRKVNIQTFHSFAYNYMTERGISTAKPAGDNVLRFSVFTSLMENNALNYDKSYIISVIVPTIASSIEYVKNFGIMPEDVDTDQTRDILERVYDEVKKSGRNTKYTIEEVRALLQHFVDAYRSYEQTKAESSDYTDILLRFRKNVSGPQYAHALIDEMQDMNKIQAEIAEDVARTMFLVGDPKQAIFGFQGGSTRYFESLRLKCKREDLTENRRSTNEILEYAKRHYLKNTDTTEEMAKNLEKMKSSRNGGGGDIPTIISTESPLSSILYAIQENQNQEIGILARANAQVLEISKMLDENNIPHTSATVKTTTETAKTHIIDFLSGLLRDDPELKVRAAFTAFSPYTLKEAFGISKAYSDARKNSEKTAPLFEKLDALCGDKMTIRGMNRLFDKTILPICVAQGKEWFYTARAVKIEIDEYLSSGMPTEEGFFDYLAVCKEPDIEQHETEVSGAGSSGSSGSRQEIPKAPLITLSTVHKAKGREFDVVIYWPKDIAKRDFMDIIKPAILESRGIDVSDELKEEQSRLHFVAMTRAKNKLIIISDGASTADFDIKGASRVVADDSTKEDLYESPLQATMAESGRLNEAYSLFVNNQTAECRQILESSEGDGWLEDAIFSYFEDLDSLSYSAIQEKAFEFLQRNIIKIPHPSISSEFGSMLHDGMEYALKDGLENMDKAVERYCKEHDAVHRETSHRNDYGGDSNSGGKKRGGRVSLEDTMRNGCSAISDIAQKYSGVSIDGLEKKVKVPLSVMTDHKVAKEAVFAGHIDVILKHDSGYVIIDYKTDKSKSYLSGHNKQIAAYKRMLAHAYGIPENSIDTYVAFVAIRGGVNTGRLDYEQVKSKRDAYGGFEKMLTRVLEWKSDPRLFIKEIVEEGTTYKEDELYEAVREKLKMIKTTDTQ